MNLIQMTTRAREDLKDTDAAAYRWTDAEVQDAIQRVVREYSLNHPLEQESDVATTNGSAYIDLSTLSKRLAVYSIEFPIANQPPSYEPFTLYMNKARLRERKGDGSNARVRWGKQHTLAADSTTILEEHEEIIVLGATGYLAESISIYVTDKATISGKYAPPDFRKWGEQRLAAYKEQLRSISNQRKLRTINFYVED